MSRLSGGRSITDQVVFRQDSPPAVTDSVVWIDTSGEQPQAKIYDPAAAEWLSVGVVEYTNLENRPQTTGKIAGLVSAGYEVILTDGETTMSVETEPTLADGLRISVENDSDDDRDSDIFDIEINGGEVVLESDISLKGGESEVETFNFDLLTVNEVEVPAQSRLVYDVSLHTSPDHQHVFEVSE